MNSAPDHEGHCTNCDRKTYTCYDELCESCAADQPVKCPACFEMVHPNFMTSHGICEICLDYKSEEITERTLIIIQTKGEMK